METVEGLEGIENVLLIVTDQWRGDHLKSTGHPVLDLPHLEALAAEGVTFRRHYVQCAPCGPARASLHTGLYQMNHRVVRNSTPLNGELTNLALEARKANYDPCLVGYATSTPDPRRTDPNDPRFFLLGDNMEGWREITSFAPMHRPYHGHLRQHGMAVPTDGYASYWEPEDGPFGPTQQPAKTPADLSDTAWLAQCGLQTLHSRLGQKWFLHLGFYRPHPPFIANAPYNTRYRPEDMPKPRRQQDRDVEAAQHPLLAYHLESIKNENFFKSADGKAADLDEADIAVMRAAYCGMIQEIDDQLGRVFAFLKATGQWDKTLIIFTSDHGEQLGDHYMLGKVGYFDESFHIPLIIRDPRPEADAGRGRLVDAFTEQVDVMPTILEWAGRAPPRQCDGRSLLPFCRGETPADWRAHVRYEYDFRDCITEAPQKALGLHMDDCGLAVIQDEHFKYVHFTALPPLLFDLEKDPNQFRNVVDDPAYAQTALEYAQAMLSWRLSGADKRLTGFTASPDGLIERR